MVYVKTKIESVKGDLGELSIRKRIHSRLQRYLRLDSNQSRPQKCSQPIRGTSQAIDGNAVCIEPVSGPVESLAPFSRDGQAPLFNNQAIPTQIESATVPISEIDTVVSSAIALPLLSSASHQHSSSPNCCILRQPPGDFSKTLCARDTRSTFDCLRRDGESPTNSVIGRALERAGSMVPCYLNTECTVVDSPAIYGRNHSKHTDEMCSQDVNDAHNTPHGAVGPKAFSAIGTVIHKQIISTQGSVPDEEDVGATLSQYDFDWDSQSSWFEDPIGFKYARVSGKQARGLFVDGAELDAICNGLHARRMMPLLQQDLLVLREHFTNIRVIIERKQKRIYEHPNWDKDSILEEEHQRLVAKKAQLQSRIGYLTHLRKQEMKDIFREQDSALDILVKHFVEADILIPDEELWEAWRPWTSQLPSVGSSEADSAASVLTTDSGRSSQCEEIHSNGLEQHHSLQYKAQQHANGDVEDRHVKVKYLPRPTVHSRPENSTYYTSTNSEQGHISPELVQAVEQWRAQVERASMDPTTDDDPWQIPTQYLNNLGSVQPGESSIDERAKGRIRRMIDARKVEERPSQLQIIEAEHRASSITKGKQRAC